MTVVFTPTEVRAIVRALAAVAAADGAVLGREEAFLEGFAMAHGELIGTHALLSSPLDDAQLKLLEQVVVDPAKRRQVVLLCLEMAMSDREYAPSEEQLVTRIADALGIDAEERGRMTLATQYKVDNEGTNPYARG